MKIKISRSLIIVAVLLLMGSISGKGQQPSESIRLNQIGFYPHAPKLTVIDASEVESFYLLTADLSDTVYTGTFGRRMQGKFSGKPKQSAGFSTFNNTGIYVLAVPGIGISYPFKIKAKVHEELVKAAIKGFYFQRASTALPEKWAGEWAHAAGHPDTKILVHASAANSERPENTVISSPKGWYDAGDYNKYIVNSGITVGTLLAAYEDFPAYFDTLKIQIPESSNKLPDLLDETLWNLRWMQTMQDPADGGVYHKLTTPEFEGMDTKPSEASQPRFVVQKSTTATLDFAAVMAQASRIFKKYEKLLPGFSDSCLVASENAWLWARQHPAVLYDQGAMNKKFDPDIHTGSYGDQNPADEFIWAAAELYVTTGDASYFNAVDMLPQAGMQVPNWGQVRLLGYYTLLRFEEELGSIARENLLMIKEGLTELADHLIEQAADYEYQAVIGGNAKNFVWGSNAVAANQGILLLQVYRFNNDKKYLHTALSSLDYLLGRNATGYSYVTGYGDKVPMNPHHRLSVPDKAEEPVPGLLVGGPNPGQQDGCSYPSAIADESYIDDSCSYASNEIAINWNAPLVYLAAAIEALMAGQKK